MDGGGQGPAVAIVTYPAPHGVEAETLYPGDYVPFGRGAECRLRFGYAPQPDRDVPRLAGHLVVSDGRVFVESAGTVGHRALEVRTTQRSVQIPIGEGHSPREGHFEVIVRSSVRSWTLGVTVRPPATPLQGSSSDDPPTSRYVLDLTGTQRTILATYCAPLRDGRVEPATHREVANALNYHPNTVRECLYEIWAKMFEQGIPMPEVSDKRSAVVDATRIHGLLLET
jgi:hypothetical protein